jgi:predicted transcriptional regulator of viral defense system
MDENMILDLYRRPETVLTIDEIAQMFPEISYKSLKDRLSYFTKTGHIRRLRSGVYAKLDYNPLELANKVYKPSYISLETVLFRGGVVFQTYQTIFVVSYLTRTLTIDHQDIQLRKMKEVVLTNMAGIDPQTGYFMASLERAFLDAIYIYRDYHFDNLEVINWEKVEFLKGIYRSLAFEKRVKGYYQIYQEEHGRH